jgi:predicted nucleic acid-binding protein
MDAFDADVLIYASAPGHAFGRRVLALFGDGAADATAPVGVGSLLLIPEILTKPRRLGDRRQVRSLTELLERLELLPADRPIAELATALGVTHGLRAVDAVHLATAVHAGADRFITNNRRDFPQTMREIDIVYPSELPDLPSG